MTGQPLPHAQTSRMRISATDKLQQIDGDYPLDTVIVKNGKIFVDNIDEKQDEEGSDENKRLENLLGSDDDDDDDDDYVDESKFSQDDFESFMQADDSDDDNPDTGSSTTLVEEDGSNVRDEDVVFQHLDYISYEFHEDSRETNRVQENVTRARASSFSNGHLGVDGVSLSSAATGGRAQRCSGRATYDEVSTLLKEDFDCSWRYVPLYPDSYYSSGQEIQRVSVITELPNLLRDNSAECMRRVVPKVREILHVASIDIQLAAATAFLQILERKLVSVEEYKKTFLQTILISIDNKNEEVSNAWLETLLSCIDLLPKEIVEKDVLSIAVSKGQLCQTVQARLSCCKILGKVSSKFDNLVVKNDVLPVVLSLCGDVEYEVRACMCQRLDAVAHGLGLELTKSKLLPQLIELSEDESHSVICACLETTANMIAMLDREANVNVIIPMVKELLGKAVVNVDSILPVASWLLGQLCHSLIEYLTVEDKTYFLDYFKKLCKVGTPERKNKENTVKMVESAVDMFEVAADTDTETRKNAAYNFPAMVVFAGTKHFRSELYPSFSHLCRDPHFIVRKTIAAGFHEVAKVLGTNVIVIFPELNVFLNDPDIEILKVIVPIFQDILSPLAALGVNQLVEQKAQAVQDVVSNFLRLEGVVFISPCWRVQESMLLSMSCLHQLCSNEFVYSKVLPLLLEKLKNGRALPVKVAAAKSITVLTRHLKYKSQREVIQILIDEFHRHKSCYCRSLFIDLARCYLKENSKQAFKDHFFDHILAMRSDRVATVRLKMLTIFPDMKRSLSLPRDQTLRTAMDTVLRQIIVYDKDRDVQQMAHQVAEELALISEGSDNSRTANRNLTAEEKEDLKKEDEEKEIIAKEEKEKKDEEAKAGKGNDKKSLVSGGKKDVQSKIPNMTKGSGPLKAQSTAGTKDSSLQQPVTKRPLVASVSAGNNKALNDISNCDQWPPSLTKSKSTTNIPSLVRRQEPRPSTPPKKESVRRIPVLVACKTASSSTSLAGSTTNKKLSPTSNRNAVTSLSSASPSLSGALSSTSSSSRRASSNSINSTSLSKLGSMVNTLNTGGETFVKLKPSVTPAKGNNTSPSEGSVMRVNKKSGK